MKHQEVINHDNPLLMTTYFGLDCGALLGDTDVHFIILSDKIHTVKPVYSSHPWDRKTVAFVIVRKRPLHGE